LAVTGTSGPGVALKSEAMNLAIALELPMVIINVQRGGPSTGLPTKTEQSDLLQAMFGRNGESPIAILAPRSPSDCFDIAIEACRMAIRSMSPVMILSDGFLANSSEPWLIPDANTIADIPVEHPAGHAPGSNGAANGNGHGAANGNGHEPFMPYLRDPETLARPWAIPGTPGLEHRIGGLSKAPVTGNVSYNPMHHEQMVAERAQKVAALADIIPEQEVYGPETGDLLLISWGGTFGSVRTAVSRELQRGRAVAHVHLRHLNPFPHDLRDIMSRYRQILVPELNGGQLAFLLRGKYALSVQSYTKLQGRPFTIAELTDKIEAMLA
jgi:2-oxoglutarate ferredoxin oxidoreductase subunit alpha